MLQGGIGATNGARCWGGRGTARTMIHRQKGAHQVFSECLPCLDHSPLPALLPPTQSPPDLPAHTHPLLAAPRNTNTGKQSGNPAPQLSDEEKLLGREKILFHCFCSQILPEKQEQNQTPAGKALSGNVLKEGAWIVGQSGLPARRSRETWLPQPRRGQAPPRTSTQPRVLALCLRGSLMPHAAEEAEQRPS